MKLPVQSIAASILVKFMEEISSPLLSQKEEAWNWIACTTYLRLVIVLGVK